VRRVLAAAVLAVAACKSPPASRPSAPEAAAPDASVAEDASVEALSAVDAGRDAGSSAGALLESARSLRGQVERELLEGPASLAQAADHARLCTEDAHRAGEVDRSVAAGADASVEPTPQAVEALYLQAVCTAAWLRTQGFTPLIERRTELFQALSRVAQADPDLDGAGAERELGALFAELPANAGGDLQKARSHLDAAIARAPDEPRNHLVYARTVAVKAQDRVLFERELGKVASEAQAEARALLDREDDLFGPAQAAQPVPGGPQH